MYVGKAKDLKNRVSSYFSGTPLNPRTQLMVSKIKKIKTVIVESELESLLLEANFIKKYLPKYNIKLTDGKAYPLIRIPVKDTYPAVLYARRADDSNSLYFGPYPSTQSMRMVLRVLRKIFPFQSVINHPKRICLYYHLGLCPCLPALELHVPSRSANKRNEISQTLHFFKMTKAYKRTIKHIIDFLDGKTKKVLKELEKERDNASKQEDFETAQKIQKQIDAIFYVTHPVHKPFEYETNPNLREDLRQQELGQLKNILERNGISVDNLERIECYDISNIQGTNPTASMVVLTNGEIDKSQYRKFKMHTKGPNDFAMMAEVIERRLKHDEWKKPNLIVVDGGKGQISSAKKVLEELKSTIPLIGLAKREETIITSEFKEILLSKSSKALQVIMRIRDEAHRFAITYHKKLRSKMMWE